MIINLTPHPIHICDGIGNVVRTFEAGCSIARLKTETVVVKDLEGIPITKTAFGDPVGLPAENWVATAKGVLCGYIGSTYAVALARFHESNGFYPDLCILSDYYIVSQLIKSAFPERNDLLVPAEVVRDSSGNIVGCRSLGI